MITVEEDRAAISRSDRISWLVRAEVNRKLADQRQPGIAPEGSVWLLHSAARDVWNSRVKKAGLLLTNDGGEGASGTEVYSWELEVGKSLAVFASFARMWDLISRVLEIRHIGATELNGEFGKQRIAFAQGVLGAHLIADAVLGRPSNFESHRSDDGPVYLYPATAPDFRKGGDRTVRLRPDLIQNGVLRSVGSGYDEVGFIAAVPYAFMVRLAEEMAARLKAYKSHVPVLR